jgi:DNA-binding MarR family transcriptional regulator
MINEVVRSDAEVAARLRPVLLRLARELRREVHQLGITGGQAMLLAVIEGNPGLSLKELAESERMSPAAMSGHVDRLEKAALVRRVRDEVDRRRVGLVLTREGTAMLRRVRSQRTAWLAERLKRLDPEQVRAIDEATDAIAALLEEAE